MIIDEYKRNERNGEIFAVFAQTIMDLKNRIKDLEKVEKYPNDPHERQRQTDMEQDQLETDARFGMESEKEEDITKMPRHKIWDGHGVYPYPDRS